MATVSKGRTFVSGETVTPAKLNELVDLATVTAIQTADISDSQITTAKIADASSTTTGVTNSKLRHSAALSVIGNTTNASAAPADIAAANDGEVLRRSGTAVGFGQIATAGIADSAVTPAKLSQKLTFDTAKASTSGTFVDFTGIPSWARRITVMFSGVSTNGTSVVIVQLGTSGGFVTSGYLGSANSANYTTGFADGLSGASVARHGAHFINHFGSNLWCASVVVGASGASPTNTPGGFSVNLGGALTQVRVTTVNGTDTFDAGTINIAYEG